MEKQNTCFTFGQSSLRNAFMLVSGGTPQIK